MRTSEGENATVEIASAGDYGCLDADAPKGSPALEYAVAPTQPGCDRSAVCPEVADACATTTPIGVEQ
ncbi:hypothetical protein [Cellulomonas timonensis]|uniref:hypothetical protein n=1 Tax=Cellulomonas timonensis TaxID=1689271 RepID=UPI000829AA74|nr:hypothetical protein [Cellulomonas timonensis]